MIVKFTLDNDAVLLIDSDNIDYIFENSAKYSSYEEIVNEVILITKSGKEYILKHSINDAYKILTQTNNEESKPPPAPWQQENN